MEEEKQYSNNTENKEKDTEINTKYDLIISASFYFIVIGFILFNFYSSLRYTYYASDIQDSIIIKDRVKDEYKMVRVFPIILDSPNKNWRFLGRFKYINKSLKPCHAIRIDKYKQEAEYVQIKSCSADNDPLGLGIKNDSLVTIDKKKIAEEIEARREKIIMKLKEKGYSDAKIDAYLKAKGFPEEKLFKEMEINGKKFKIYKELNDNEDWAF